MTVTVISPHPRVDETIQEEWQGIVEILAEFMGTPIASIVKLSHGHISVVVCNHNTNPLFLELAQVCSGSNLYCEQVVATDARVFVFNAMDDKYWSDHPAIQYQLINYLGYPIHWPNGDIFGTLCILNSTAQHYSDKQERLMIQLRNMIETHLELVEKNLALENVSKDLRHLANTDELTNVLNRRAFIAESEKELQRAKRHGHHSCLLMMDLDNFKDINDQYGHEIGDEVLRLFSHCIRASKRPYDIFGRIGGEEFAILLVETKCSHAIEQAERIRKKVANIFFHTHGQQIQITASIGVCELTRDEPGILSGLSRADKFLYQAKREGKNRVCAV